MAEGDVAGALSVRLVKHHDMTRSRTVTVFTKVDYHFYMPQRVVELVKKEDPNGILVMTRKPNIETQRDEIVEEETEMSLLSGFRTTVAVGRKVVLERIKDFTSDMIEKNRAQIISSLTKQQRSIAEVLYKIGDIPERPTQIHFRWSRNTRDLVFEIKEGRNGTYVENLEKLRLEIPKVLPMEWPEGKRIQPHEAQRDLDQIRGTHLDFMVGSEPLVKKYTKLVTEFISGDLFSWVDRVENTLREMINLALTQEPGVPNSCLEAGGRVASDILVLLGKMIDKWRADLKITLEDVHQNPRLLDSNDVAKKIKDLRDAPITRVIELLQQNNLQGAVGYLLQVKANTNSIKETEAMETIIKTTAYWRGRMTSFQKNIFQQMNEIRDKIENEICDAVDRFEDVDLLKENDVQTHRRENLKNGDAHCKAVLDALRVQ
jgi:hypothetical protein